MLSKLAQQHELGSSILERLFTHYKSSPQRRASIQNHTASLLTNYRCHSSILTLTSSLFYEHTLLSDSRSQRMCDTHPLAPYPLVFTCSSIVKKSLMSVPAENQHEAKVLVEKIETFIEKCPRKNRKYRLGVLASTRQQVGNYTLQFLHSIQ